MTTIVELANELGVSNGNILYWEKQFPALRPELIIGTKGAGRLYTKEEADKVRDFNNLLAFGFTCKGARRNWKRRRTLIKMLSLN